MRAYGFVFEGGIGIPRAARPVPSICLLEKTPLGTSEEFLGLSRKDLKPNMFGRRQVLTSAENVNTLVSFYSLLPRSEYFHVSAWSGLSLPRKLELGLKGKPWKLKDD